MKRGRCLACLVGLVHHLQNFSTTINLPQTKLVFLISFYPEPMLFDLLGKEGGKERVRWRPGRMAEGRKKGKSQVVNRYWKGVGGDKEGKGWW